MDPMTTAAAGPDSEKRSKAEPGALKRPMRDDDLLSFVWVADPQISPDGTRVAFTRVHVDREADEYRTAVWLVEVAGGEARPLTGGGRDSQPRWSPDGSRLAFIRKPDSEKPGQLHVLPMTGGEAAALTSLVKGASNPAWSPDGRRLSFLSGTNSAIDDLKAEKPKHEPARVITHPVFRWNDQGFIDREHPDHVWVIEAAGGAPRQLTHGRFIEESPRWSRDGRSILFVSDRRAEPWFGADESGLYAVSSELASPTDGEAMRRVLDYPGAVHAFAESADGRFATIGRILDGTARTYDQLDVLVGGGVWPIVPKALNATRDHAFGETASSDQHPPRGGGGTPLAWAEDGRALLALATRHGGGMLVRVDATSGAVTELTPITRDLIMGSSTPDGRHWAFTLGDVTTPGDLVVFDADTKVLKKLYGPNDALLAGIALGSVEELWYDAKDGSRIHAWVVTPPDLDRSRPHPMVLEIHGGPHTAYGQGFYHEFHVLAGAGYVVLYTNPRGSTSYGEPFADCIQYAYPGEDYGDLMSGVDLLVERGLADPKRLGVTGGSGGGLLTNWIVAHTDRFAAAVTQRCVADWMSMVWSSDFAMFTPFWFRRQPHEDAREYIDRSPVYLASKINTPLMVIHSEEDWRTPIGQGEAMFRALKVQRKPTVMVRFPGENHELSRSGMPSRRVQNQQHIRAWFDHWLMGKTAPQYDV